MTSFFENLHPFSSNDLGKIGLVHAKNANSQCDNSCGFWARVTKNSTCFCLTGQFSRGPMSREGSQEIQKRVNDSSPKRF